MAPQLKPPQRRMSHRHTMHDNIFTREHVVFTGLNNIAFLLLLLLFFFQGVLTQVTQTTKMTLNQLGVFTVSSVHAYICARSPSLLSNLLAGRGASKRKTSGAGVVGSIGSKENFDNASYANKKAGGGNVGNDEDVNHVGSAIVSIPVLLPNKTVTTVKISTDSPIDELLNAVCVRSDLNNCEHFLRLKKHETDSDKMFFAPAKTDVLSNYIPGWEVVELCTKSLYQLELTRANVDTMWGFSIEAELVENQEKQDELCCYVSRVEDKSVACKNGNTLIHFLNG